jgi:hypothetical protein
MKFLIFENSEAAAARAVKLAGVSVGYDPTTQQVGGQAVEPVVVVHPDDGRAAILVDNATQLETGERRRLRGRERMFADGWFVNV